MMIYKAEKIYNSATLLKCFCEQISIVVCASLEFVAAEMIKIFPNPGQMRSKGST